MSPHRKLRLEFYPTLTVILLGAVTLFHLWYSGSGAIDLAKDEAVYWEYSRRLDWGYYEKGPLTPYLIAASTRLGGNSEFFVRLPAVLLALGTAVIAYLFAKRLFSSDRAAFLAVAVLSVMPIYAVGSILMTIDTPFLFFWALAIFALHKAIGSPQPSFAGQKMPPSNLSVKAASGSGDPEHRRSNAFWWSMLGIALGFGFLSAYKTIFLLPCIAVYILCSPRARAWWGRKEPFFALIWSGLLIMPMVVWNAQHGWISFRHTVANAQIAGFGAEIEPFTETFFGFVGSQLGIVSPLILVALVFAVVRSGHLGLRGGRDEHLLLFSFSAPLLAFFLLWSLFRKVQANWPASAYFAATIALAGWAEEIYQKAHGFRRRYTLPAAFAVTLVPALLIVTFGHFPSLLDVIGIDLPRKHDPTRRLQGWSELGQAVGRVLQDGGGEEPVAIVSNRHEIASELAFYVPGQPHVFTINLRRRLSQHDLWGGLETFEGEDVLFVTREGDKQRYGAVGGVPPEVLTACEGAEEVDVVRTFHRGRPGYNYSIFLCRGLRASRVRRVKIHY
ncbi:MAG: ArnT family glycosyltransferase [Nitrospiraceae bacterium]